MENNARWLLLIHCIPWEPSRYLVAVWRKLKALGALYLQDGVAALPEDAVIREQLEWLQLRVRRPGKRRGGGRPGTVAEDKELDGALRSSHEEAYDAIAEGAERVRRKVELGGDRRVLLEELGRLERNFRAERRRDYFRSTRGKEVVAVLKATREAARGAAGEELELWG